MKIPAIGSRSGFAFPRNSSAFSFSSVCIVTHRVDRRFHRRSQSVKISNSEIFPVKISPMRASIGRFSRFLQVAKIDFGRDSRKQTATRIVIRSRQMSCQVRRLGTVTRRAFPLFFFGNRRFSEPRPLAGQRAARRHARATLRRGSPVHRQRPREDAPRGFVPELRSSEVPRADRQPSPRKRTTSCAASFQLRNNARLAVTGTRSDALVDLA